MEITKMINKFEYDPQYHEYYPSPEMEREMEQQKQQDLYNEYYYKYEDHAIAYKLSMEEVYGPNWWRYK